MAGLDGATSMRRGYRRRLAAAAVASVMLHMVLARGLALTTLGLDGRAAEAPAAPKQARKPARDFPTHTPRVATNSRPAHERPLTIAVAPREAGRASAAQPTQTVVTEQRPADADAAAMATTPAPQRARDTERFAAATPARASPVTAPAAPAALADAAATAPAEADATPAPAALARDRDAPDAVASRWRPREVALLERLLAPAPMQPEPSRDDAGDERPTAPATAGDRPQGRRPLAVTGAKAAVAPVDAVGEAAAAEAPGAPAVGPTRRRAPQPRLGGAGRAAAAADAEADAAAALAAARPGIRGGGSSSRDRDEDAAPVRAGGGGPARAPVASGGSPTAAIVAGAEGVAADAAPEPAYGPRAVGRAADADSGSRMAASLPGIGRAAAGAGPDEGEELSVPIPAVASGPRRDDDDDDDEGRGVATPRPPERIAVVPLPPDSRVRDAAEAFARRGRDPRDPRRSDPRVRRADEAVDRGLAFLARAQQPDGRWSLGRFAGSTPADAPELTSDTAATGLALLAFLGAGHDHFEGPHRDTVRRGLEFLLAVQKPDGDLYLPADDLSNSCAWLYSHGIASIALCEAVGMTGDPLVRPAAARACGFIAASRHPERGGWRYVPRGDADLSVSGWMLVALRSGALAGVETDPRALDGVRTLLEAAADPSAPARYAYNPAKPDQRAGEASGLCMTAVGALMRLHTGARTDDPRVAAAARALAARRPAYDGPGRDSYLWYYASQVLVHTGGAGWDAWYAALVDALAAAQESAGPRAGSWNPLGPHPDRWGRWGGRVYVTALHLLALEVPDRRLPTYTAAE